MSKYLEAGPPGISVFNRLYRASVTLICTKFANPLLTILLSWLKTATLVPSLFISLGLGIEWSLRTDFLKLRRNLVRSHRPMRKLDSAWPYRMQERIPECFQTGLYAQNARRGTRPNNTPEPNLPKVSKQTPVPQSSQMSQVILLSRLY